MPAPSTAPARAPAAVLLEPLYRPAVPFLASAGSNCPTHRLRHAFVVEVNTGGEMVETLISTVAAEMGVSVNVKPVRATSAKSKRAERAPGRADNFDEWRGEAGFRPPPVRQGFAELLPGQKPNEPQESPTPAAGSSAEANAEAVSGK